MIEPVKIILGEVRSKITSWWLLTLGFTLGYYLLQLGGLILKFQKTPNYLHIHEWHINVMNIFKSTPSLTDSFSIMANEWVLEVGYMNYDYGHGISEWSLFLAPVKTLVIMFLGGLVATYVLLLRRQTRAATHLSAPIKNLLNFISGLGTACVALTSLTMSWVVCCATPTWIVALAMMGLSVSTAFMFEAAGVWISYCGFLILLMSLFIAAKRLNSLNQFARVEDY